MAEHTDRTRDRRRALQELLQGEYPDRRVVVEAVATGGFDGFQVWASRPDDGKRTLVHKLTRDELSAAVFDDLAAVVRAALSAGPTPRIA